MNSNFTECSFPLKDISFVIQNVDEKDLEKILNIINLTHDQNLLVKLFSFLSAYLVSNNTHIDVIIKSKSLYDKINEVLHRGLPQKTTTTLIFITSLFYVDNNMNKLSRRYTLAMYARNMIRINGCLATICNLFNNYMMHQDTWRALCQCIAEVCQSSDLNKKYCAHLVPSCVRIFSKGDENVLIVLESLLDKNEKNVELFIKSNGINIFTRDSLQDNIVIQLLNMAVEASTRAVTLINETQIPLYLENISRLHYNSKVGQWADIILYRLIKQQSKGPKMELSSDKNETKLQNVNELCKGPSIDDSIYKVSSENTSNLFRNIMEEINRCHPENNIQSLVNSNKTTKFFVPRKMTARGKYSDKEIQQTVNLPTMGNEVINSSIKCNKRTKVKNVTSHSQRYDMSLSFLMSKKSDEVENDRNTHVSFCDDIIDFKPPFTSTPKQNCHKKIKNISRSFSNKSQSNTQSIVNIRMKATRRLVKGKKDIQKDKSKSMSTRLFNIINDSCTTLVKTVKNIFKYKQEKSSSQELPSSVKSKNLICNYSFTKYMHKKDAILNDKHSFSNDTILDKVNLCKTCNDTLILKQKLLEDIDLKKTVKKLKLGINLYGCDFKRISRTFWPRERYMSPTVLYNLYRKLLVK